MHVVSMQKMNRYSYCIYYEYNEGDPFDFYILLSDIRLLSNWLDLMGADRDT